MDLIDRYFTKRQQRLCSNLVCVVVVGLFGAGLFVASHLTRWETYLAGMAVGALCAKLWKAPGDFA